MTAALVGWLIVLLLGLACIAFVWAIWRGIRGFDYVDLSHYDDSIFDRRK
jgi:hypothetical protein